MAILLVILIVVTERKEITCRNINFVAGVICSISIMAKENFDFLSNSAASSVMRTSRTLSIFVGGLYSRMLALMV